VCLLDIALQRQSGIRKLVLKSFWIRKSKAEIFCVINLKTCDVNLMIVKNV